MKLSEHCCHYVRDGILGRKQTKQNGGCFKYKTLLVLATEDNLSMSIHKADSVNPRKKQIPSPML